MIFGSCIRKKILAVVFIYLGSLALTYVSFANASGDLTKDPNSPFYVPVPVPPPYFEKEADKAAFILKAIKNNTFSVVKTAFENDKPFCTQFLEDFRTQFGIEHIEPTVRSDPYEASVFEPYLGNCRALDIRKRSYSPRPDFEIFSYGRRDAKLYAEELNNNVSDGKELVFYADEFVRVYGEELPKERVDEELAYLDGIDLGIELESHFSKRYDLVNTQKCLVGPSVAYGAGDGSVSGLIRYGGKPFIYRYKYTPLSVSRKLPERFIQVWAPFPNLESPKTGKINVTRQICTFF